MHLVGWLVGVYARQAGIQSWNPFPFPFAERITEIADIVTLVIPALAIGDAN